MFKFFCWNNVQPGYNSFLLPAPEFSDGFGADPQLICCQAPIRIKTTEKHKIRRLHSGDIQYLGAKQPFLFLSSPWSIKRTPKNHRYLVHVQWIVTEYRAPFGPTIEGSWQGQTNKKGHPPGSQFFGSATVRQPEWRVLNHHEIEGHRCSPKLNREQFLTERNLIPDDVITDASQFIAQRFSGKARVYLCGLAIIISSEPFAVSARQMGRFDKSPAQIPISVFAIATAFAFAVRKSLRWYTAAIGSKVADLRETANITHFQLNGHRQDIADARNRQQLLKRIIQLYFLLYHFF